MSSNEEPKHIDTPKSDPKSKVIKVHGFLAQNNPYVGTFHYAPSAGNRARQTYFAKDIRSLEQINKQHAILKNPNIGIFHYGDYVYGDRFEELQCNLKNFKDQQNLVRQRNNHSKESSNSSGLSAKSEFIDQKKCCNQARSLKESARICAVYASGDNLIKLGERERRMGNSKRFKYNGAIDLCKRYPIGGSIDDCALLRSYGASRSSHYNRLLAEVNGFRNDFVEQQRSSNLNPKEAYRLLWISDSDNSNNLYKPKQRQESFCFNASNDDENEEESRERSSPLNSIFSNSAPTVATSRNRSVSIESEPKLRSSFNINQSTGRNKSFITIQNRIYEEKIPGQAWIPGTINAQINKEKWQNNQVMRDTSKFHPFFVQSKSRIVDSYDLFQDNFLGQGSYANVILARHKSTQQLFAIKAVEKKLLFSDTEKTCVMNEVENQLRIVHKHIVRLYEVYETPDFLYLVLENCSYGDLEKMLYLRGHFKEIEVKRVAHQLIQGVAYLHSKGIVHCDIKPQNLLFSFDTEKPVSPQDSPKNGAMKLGNEADKLDISSPAGLAAKLCDFGLSRKVPDVKFFKLTGDINKIPFSALCGTGGFIAPEILRQQPFGKPADMWSIGVMIYHMLSGRMPFAPARKCLDNPPSYTGVVWKNTSCEAKELIDKLLEKDPSKRITAAEALEHPWLESVQHINTDFPHFVPTR
mmetsp:Transcript_8127/g.12324  ORF Transcript_8127/g.12324 Transcript_8127/m.12324 type:complete len:695 (-) Transcript_8127:85-2169(-)|eukprot:CAMPEP_0171456442 /NCGR_PEP_ID=MMETSP0945-20130129/2923_1 /TAXON_ID=109269 /ORGANISM="Vaucheria litorea, Strain CCMP2940" /LENGTH=694 /DNA_ID=CAMNT_0011981859 /DNA_START=52 /DNA_END=2136 /DNA_ORIENTATION=-